MKRKRRKDRRAQVEEDEDELGSGDREIVERSQSGFYGLDLGQGSYDVANRSRPRQLLAAAGQVEDWDGGSSAALSGPSVGHSGQRTELESSRSGFSFDSGGVGLGLEQNQTRRMPGSGPPGFSQGNTQMRAQDRRGHAFEMEDEDEDEFLWLPAGRHRYDKAVELGYILAVKLAWQHVFQDQTSVSNQIDEADWIWHSYNVLLGMQKEVLTAVASGNLSRLYRGHDNETVKAMFNEDSAWIEEGQGLAPVVYILCLVDSKDGCRAHTPAELRLVIEDLRHYGDMKWPQLTLKVDNAYRSISTMKDIQAGRPYFLAKSGKNRRIRTRYKAEDIKRFCDALELRPGRLPADERDAPLRRPLQYVGRALKFADGKAQHSRVEKSNWLIHLVKHVCNVRWPGRFSLDTFPISYQANDGEVQCAQMQLALIADSFAASGGGFNRAAPVLSGLDISNEDPRLVKGFWAEREEFRDVMGFGDANLPAQLAFEAEVTAVKDRGEVYDPSKGSEGTEDSRLRTSEEELAEDEAKLERSRAGLVARNAEGMEKLKRLTGAE
ncbi:hypothetical protein P171DRAFT_499855 [Karstenula rhodostoma CBS 690.94]|uniref:Uncharacterized protein n=1 Tax=Karstenula rhodostoma CBS 690.94 TaxID=1392251 RepID=A0A9P4PAN2_9PLEO|nr:hypothetical protein P171DRAFT_499855 [Karstenula rhodostoma CBS 690.94]